MEMPPLPEMDVYHDDHAFGSGPESFSEKALLAYGESCARMAREEAAKVDNAAEIRKCAQLVIEEAFKLPAPNEHTPPPRCACGCDSAHGNTCRCYQEGLVTSPACDPERAIRS